MKNCDVRIDPAAPAMKSLTSCQANRTRVAVKAVRTDPAAPAMKSLTHCQANRTRVAVKAVRTDPAAPAMKSLTVCQANRTRVAVKADQVAVNCLISMSKTGITLLQAKLASMPVFPSPEKLSQRLFPLPFL